MLKKSTCKCCANILDNRIKPNKTFLFNKVPNYDLKILHALEQLTFIKFTLIEYLYFTIFGNYNVS